MCIGEGCLFFFEQKTAYEVSLGLVGSEMCIRDRFRGFDLIKADPSAVLGTSRLAGFRGWAG